MTNNTPDRLEDDWPNKSMIGPAATPFLNPKSGSRHGMMVNGRWLPFTRHDVLDTRVAPAEYESSVANDMQTIKIRGDYLPPEPDLGQMTMAMVPVAVYPLIHQIGVEYLRQEARWGPDQTHPDEAPMSEEYQNALTSIIGMMTNVVRDTVSALPADQRPWWAIAFEEFMEAVQERDWTAQRNEIIQVAAVCLSWLVDGDRRHVMETTSEET